MTRFQDEDVVTVAILKAVINETFDQKLAGLSLEFEKLEEFKQRAKELEYKVEELEEYNRRNDLIFHGIPLTEDEDPLSVVAELGRTINMEITPDAIDVAHRFKSKSNKMLPPFIIRFVNRWKRDAV